VVAAIVAGDADGVAEAYDRYAASLYTYCCSVLPGPEAAEAVLDTFAVAAARLPGLRDPDRLGAWLHAVARNECLRQLGPDEPGYAAGADSVVPGLEDPDDEPPAATLPPELRGQVLTVCADNSPAGRAHRMSVAHRAGTFGPAGFPKPAGSPRPQWWRGARRRPRLAAAAAVAAALAVVAGLTVVMTAGGAHRPQAAALRLGGAVPASASGTVPGSASGAPTPSGSAPASTPASPLTTPTPGSGSSPGTPDTRGTPQPSASPAPSPASPSPSPSPSSPPAQGHLRVAPDTLVLMSATGQPASGSFKLTATGGPVSHFAIKFAAVAGGQIRVSPTGGSLPANGSVVVTVTVTSKVALDTHLTVEPGNLIVTVVFKL